MKQRNILIIVGPTGVGKTDSVDNLNLKIEVINCDVGQFYEPLSIGTAKPNLTEQKNIHHMFDLKKEPEDLSVIEYRKKVSAIVENIFNKNENILPVIVGGSLFYIQSLFFPPKENIFINKKNIEIQTGTWQELFELDKNRAEKIHPNDQYRIDRALTILKNQTEIKASDLKQKYDPFCKFDKVIICFINRDRKELHQRINLRVNHMFELGWQNEIKSFLNTPWEKFLLKKKLIGYDQIINNLKTNSLTQKELINSISIKTRQYAKRQITFWKMLSKKFVTQNSCDTIKIYEHLIEDNKCQKNNFLYNILKKEEIV